MSNLSFLNHIDNETPIFYFEDEIINIAALKEDALLLADNLPKHKYTINLCEDRYLFALGFVASIILKNICLLPANRTEKEIADLEKDYPDAQRIDDDLIATLIANTKTTQTSFPTDIDAEQLVAIVFTSGSSGKPKANLKYWGALVGSAQRVALQLKLNQPQQHTIVATVPPQHMYGFETTIIFPLITGVCVYNKKPFFPEDIRQTINNLATDVILVSTPIHIRACAQTKLRWPKIDFVLSATAPLSLELAKNVEQQLQTTVKEIYGCSEAGVIATRNTTQNLDWSLLPDYKLTKKLTGICLITSLYDEEILLPDQIKQLDESHFRLLGRQSDLVKIAGKRGSLGDLKIKLCALNGVEDAVFFIPSDNPAENTRLAAFVVAPTLSTKEIHSFFQQQVDNAFVPRPLIKVDKLPYNETGKLPRKNLLNLFALTRNQKHFKDSA